LNFNHVKPIYLFADPGNNDINQNMRGKIIACANSPRTTAQATVFAPLRWEELGKVCPTDFTIATVPDRLQKNGDLWADILSNKKDVKKVLLTKT